MVETKTIPLPRKIRHYLTMLFHLAIGKLNPDNGCWSENFMSVSVKIDRENMKVIASLTPSFASMFRDLPSVHVGDFVNEYRGSRETWDESVAVRLAVLGLVKLVGAGLMNKIGELVQYMEEYMAKSEYFKHLFKKKLIVHEDYVISKPGVREGGRYVQLSQGMKKMNIPIVYTSKKHLQNEEKVDDEVLDFLRSNYKNEVPFKDMPEKVKKFVADHWNTSLNMYLRYKDAAGYTKTIKFPSFINNNLFYWLPTPEEDNEVQ